MKKPDLRFRKPGQIMEAAGILHANFDDFVSYFCDSSYDSLMCDATCVFLPKLDMLPPETRHFEGDFLSHDTGWIRVGEESGLGTVHAMRPESLDHRLVTLPIPVCREKCMR